MPPRRSGWASARVRGLLARKVGAVAGSRRLCGPPPASWRERPVRLGGLARGTRPGAL